MHRKCLERTKLLKDRKVMQKYLYFKNKHDQDVKTKILKKLGQPRQAPEDEEMSIVKSFIHLFIHSLDEIS